METDLGDSRNSRVPFPAAVISFSTRLILRASFIAGHLSSLLKFTEVRRFLFPVGGGGH